MLIFGGGHVNGAAMTTAYAGRYGARAGQLVIGEILLGGPGFVAMLSAITVAVVVRNLVARK